MNRFMYRVSLLVWKLNARILRGMQRWHGWWFDEQLVIRSAPKSRSDLVAQPLSD